MRNFFSLATLKCQLLQIYNLTPDLKGARMQAPTVATTGSLPSGAQDEGYFAGLWQRALDDCSNTLGEFDFKNLNEFNDLDELMVSIRRQADEYAAHIVPMIQSLIQPCLKKLQTFATVIAITARGPVVQTAIIWGLARLLFEATNTSHEKLKTVFEMLDNMAWELTIIDEYKSDIQQHADLEEILIRTYVLMIKFLSDVAQYLKKHPAIQMVESVVSYLKSEKSGFDATRKEMKDNISRLKELAGIRRAKQRPDAEMLSKMDRLQVTQPTYPSCNNLLQSNTNFCCRESLIDILHEQLDHTKDKRFRSYALFGLAGIGKSSTALAYAHKRVQQGVKYCLWIRAETDIERDASFTEFAMKLGLPGILRDGDPAKNRREVINWLERLEEDWLMVLDNVDHPGTFKTCLSSSRFGSMLVTCRAKSMAQGYVLGTKPVDLLTIDDGAYLLMKLVNREPYSDDEKLAARAFSEEMDGLPLGLELVSSRICRINKSIRKYLDQFQKNPTKLHQTNSSSVGLYYPKGMDTLAHELYGNLEPGTIALMGVLSFMAADNIPLAMFEDCPAEKLPPSLSFCADVDDLDEAIEPLLNQALVRKDPETEMLSLHRFIQDSHRAWMGSDPAFEKFRAAAQTLHNLFPVHEGGGALRNQWHACRLYVSHVMSLCLKYRISKFKTVFPADLDKFLELLKSCGWYLMERGSWLEFMDLFKTAEQVCVDKESLAWAHLCNTAGCVEYERGNAKRSRPYMEKSLAIRERQLPWLHLERSDAYNNFANLLLTESLEPDSLEKALEKYRQAIEIDNQIPGGDKVSHTRYLNLGAVYTWQGKYQDAFDAYETGRTFAINTFGPGCHFVGRIDYLQGRNWLYQQKWDDSYSAFDKALKIFIAENDMHHGVAAVKLKLGQIEIERKNFEEAIRLLREARVICELNEGGKGDQGDTARICRTLAKALAARAKAGDTEESARLKQFAEEVRRQVQGDRYQKLGDSDESYNLMIFHGDR